MSLTGKGFFILDLSDCEGGDPDAIYSAAQAAGLAHVVVKVAEGSHPYGIDPVKGDRVPSLVAVLKQGGIGVWGWQAITGDNPSGEAEAAARRVHDLGLDGFVVNAGVELKKDGGLAAVETYMQDLRHNCSVPIALNSYSFPNFHPHFPWSGFLEKCDYVMPRVFWEQAHNAGWQLRESKRQYDALPHARPYLATASAYRTVDGWAPTESDMTTFLDTAQLLGIVTVNFYHWTACRKDLPLLWKVIGEQDWQLPSETHIAVG